MVCIVFHLSNVYLLCVCSVLLDDEFGENGLADVKEGAGARFMYIGRILAHSAPITGLTFGLIDTRDFLVSVSEDKYTVEYDLYNSTTATGILTVGSGNAEVNMNSRNPLDLDAVPTAVMWHPHLEDDVEDR